MNRPGWWPRWCLVSVGSCALACGARGPSEAIHAQSPARESTQDELDRLWHEGVTLGHQRRYLEAEAPLRQAVAKSRAIQGTDPKPLLRSLAALASCLVSLDRPDEARAALREALPLAKPGTLEGDQMLYRLNVTLAESFRQDRRYEEAVAPFRAAFEAGRRLPAKHAIGIVDAAVRLADTLDLLQRHREGIAPLTAALAVAEREAVAARYVKRVALQLAASHAALGERERAGELLRPHEARARQLRTSDASLADLPAPEALTASIVAVDPVAASPAETASELTTRAWRVASLRESLRACHPAALSDGRETEGEMRLVVSIEADGQVTEAKGVWIGLPAATADCVLQRAAAVRFDPLASATVLAVPMSFRQRED